MVEMYCRAHHGTRGKICDDCAELLVYAEQRLGKCPYHEDKPVCNKCPIHCYKPDRREQVRVVMRYAGPRMLWRHPVLAIRHMIDKRREPPPGPKGKPAQRTTTQD